jgi:hypothetical protein
LPSESVPAGGPGGAPVALLETYANNSSIHKGLPARWQARYLRRYLLWDESSLERVRKCGRVPVRSMVSVRRTGDVVGLAGLASCGSVWADPVCNAKIMARRSLEIGAAVALWQSQGGQVALHTFTMRHRAGQPLGTLWDALQGAWARATTGTSWYRDRAAHGLAGWLRVVEVTVGRNGWHVHVHALLLLRGKATPGTVSALHRSMVGRWSRGLVAAGLSAPLMAGQDARLISGPADSELARYFTKSVDQGRAMGLELTQSQGKRSRSAHGTETPWTLIDRVSSGDADALDLWHEWERGSKGRRQITWSQGARDLLRIGVEVTDEEIVAEELGSKHDDLVLLPKDSWAVLVRAPWMVFALLAAAKAGGSRAAADLLDAWGLPYQDAATGWLPQPDERNGS